MQVNNTIQLAKYKGPLLLIRRWDDEMITTPDITASEDERRASNRANFLLIDVIQKRYPGLILTEEDQVPAEHIYACLVPYLTSNALELCHRMAGP